MKRAKHPISRLRHRGRGRNRGAVINDHRRPSIRRTSQGSAARGATGALARQADDQNPPATTRLRRAIWSDCICAAHSSDFAASNPPHDQNSEQALGFTPGSAIQGDCQFRWKIRDVARLSGFLGDYEVSSPEFRWAPRVDFWQCNQADEVSKIKFMHLCRGGSSVGALGQEMCFSDLEGFCSASWNRLPAVVVVPCCCHNLSLFPNSPVTPASGWRQGSHTKLPQHVGKVALVRRYESGHRPTQQSPHN